MATSDDSSKGFLQFSTVKLRLELINNLMLGKVMLYSTSNPSTSSERRHCKILNTIKENVLFHSPMKFTMEIEITPQEFYDNVLNNWGNSSNGYFIGPTMLELLKKISNDKIKSKYIQWLVAIYN